MNKTQLKKVKKTVLKKESLVFDQLTKKQNETVFKYGENYKKFLNQSKTEREAVQQIILAAKAKGFVDIDTLLTKKAEKAEKVYKVFQGRCIALAVLGKEKLISGTNIIAFTADFFFVKEQGNGGFSWGISFKDSFKAGIGTDSVILTVCTDH